MGPCSGNRISQIGLAPEQAQVRKLCFNQRNPFSALLRQQCEPAAGQSEQIRRTVEPQQLRISEPQAQQRKEIPGPAGVIHNEPRSRTNESRMKLATFR